MTGGSTTTLRALIREYLFVSLFRACADSLASENASRLAAMQRADKNIDELLEDLNGTFRRLRQSGIDDELFDVIAGFEALGGARKQVDIRTLVSGQACRESRNAWSATASLKRASLDPNSRVTGPVPIDSIACDSTAGCCCSSCR